jgi:predicted XRE-type DNA-binding protein
MKAYRSVFDAIADDAGDAANMRNRAALMMKIGDHVARRRWTQAQAAEHFGLTQPRVNDLLRGRMSKFSLDALVNIAATIGQVDISVDTSRRPRKVAEPA